MQKNEMTTGDAFDLVRSSLPTKWRKATMVGPLREDVEDLYRERITPETDLPPMMPLFSMFDVPCFYRGELVADCGKAKAGKTLFLSILMAACLKGEVLDLNKSEQDRNMRGSIGTELTNKAFEVFQCERIEESNTFKVSQSLQRKQKVRQSLCYQIGDDGLPTACCGRGRRTSDRTEPEKLRDIFTAIMEGRRQRPFKEAMAVAIKKMGFADNRAYYEAVREAEAQGIIRVTEHPDTKESWVEICDRSLFDSQEGVPF